MNYDAFIFDIDGVLLDTSQSFVAAVIDAVAYATGTKHFTTEEVVGLKSIRGFNNDWHVAIAGACWIKNFSDLSFRKYMQMLDRLGGGIKGLKKIYPNLSSEYQKYLTRLTKEAYAGTTACQELYGFEPAFIKIPGRWQNEVPLVSPKYLQAISEKAGIITGRARLELEMAFKLLKWSLSNEVIAWSDNPELDKPNPIKLIRVIRRLRARQPVYLGDTRDDLELVKNYRMSTGKSLDFCLIGTGNGIKEYDLAYPDVSGFFSDAGVSND